MVMLLPKDGDLHSLEGSLDADSLDSWEQELSNQTVQVYVPKFTFEDSYSLGDTLQGMGMKQAFSDAADFSGISGRKDLKIDSVVHKAFISVDENGTEAAGATAVIMVGTMVSPGHNPPPTPVFRADHPFIFLIQDQETGAILFMGRVADPTLAS